jgi:hypothetical protein
MNRALTPRLLGLTKRGCGLDVMQVCRASYIFAVRQGTSVSVNNIFSLMIFNSVSLLYSFNTNIGSV